jgi:methenyltetrahydromethanopterin cyclohydrolase
MKGPLTPDRAPRALGARWPSVNANVAPLVDALTADAQTLRLGVERTPRGSTLIDAGIAHRGGLEAGRRIAEICLGGLGYVRLSVDESDWPLRVHVHSADPVLACLASQYAGWSLAHGEGKHAFRALGSGPARALAGKEPLFDELGYRDRFDATCVVLEVDQLPPAEVVEKVVRDCNVSAERLTLILTPTRSLAGVVQIIARVLEVALHKVHALGFPLADIVDGAGSAPVPPPSADFVTGMGRTNDAILFGGHVQLYVEGPDDAAADLAQALPCTTSRDYGKPFAQIFRDYGFDFYRIDPLLFAPASVVVSNVASGRSFRAGAFAPELLAMSFERPKA